MTLMYSLLILNNGMTAMVTGMVTSNSLAVPMVVSMYMVTQFGTGSHVTTLTEMGGQILTLIGLLAEKGPELVMLSLTIQPSGVMLMEMDLGIMQAELTAMHALDLMEIHQLTAPVVKTRMEMDIPMPETHSLEMLLNG
tara:strand:- start:68 stop:484 length:417 start_codon:yes stop_codon:yes gene_type:complete